MDISEAVRKCTHRSNYGRELASCCDIILYSVSRVPGLAELADPEPFTLSVRHDHRESCVATHLDHCSQRAFQHTTSCRGVQVLQQLLPQLISLQPSSEAYCKLCSTCAQLTLHLLQLIIQGTSEAETVLDVFIEELLSTCAVFAEATLAGLSQHEEVAPLQPFSIFHATISIGAQAQVWTRAAGSAPDRHPYICDMEPLPDNSHSVLGWLMKVLFSMHHSYAEHMSQVSTAVVRLLTTCLPVCPVQHLQGALSVLTCLLETPGQHQSALKTKLASIASSCQSALALDCSGFTFGADSSGEALTEAAAECWLIATMAPNSPGTAPSAHAQAFKACAAALQRQQTPRLLDMAQQLLVQTTPFASLLAYAACLPPVAIHILQRRESERAVVWSVDEPTTAPQVKVQASPPARQSLQVLLACWCTDRQTPLRAAPNHSFTASV